MDLIEVISQGVLQREAKINFKFCHFTQSGIKGQKGSETYVYLISGCTVVLFEIVPKGVIPLKESGIDFGDFD